MNKIKETMNWQGKTLSLETGQIARQADGAVLVRLDDTAVLCTVVLDKSKRGREVDFFPLSVHFQEKTFAAGRIPGGFIKREGKPSEKEVLISRLIDRPIRPLFPSHCRSEIQVVCTVLSYDSQGDVDIASIIGASAAISISGIPFDGPIAACRVGYRNNQFVLNPVSNPLLPTVTNHNELDLVVAGTRKGVLMVESSANELPEAIMCDAVEFGHSHFLSVIDLIETLKQRTNKASIKIECKELSPEFQEKVTEFSKHALQRAYEIQVKQERYHRINELKEELKAFVLKEDETLLKLSLSFFEELQAEVVRNKILYEKSRIDGRSLTCVRPIFSEVGLLPRVHGSALFTRGETQVIAATTLGTQSDEQIVDNLEGEYKERFLLHYNFPPYSVGEVGRMSAPGRREVGHGKLAWRAIAPLIPDSNDFPYAMRTVSEVSESNGSSSMATVCGTSLALMDAGVPLERAIAGIAMGLIKKDDQFAVLSDILGDEDHLGDMDFKVAGTEKGVTALQMDLKIDSISFDIMRIALNQAKEGRLHILHEMKKTLAKPRSYLSPYAPRIVRVRIESDKIRDLIGPGGRVIRDICETTQTKIDVSDDGLVTISGVKSDLVDEATKIVLEIGAQPEIGAIYDGKVTRIMDFGALVQFMGGKEGMVHISEITQARLPQVSDALKLGDKVKVRVLHIEDNGRIKLSIKKAMDI